MERRPHLRPQHEREFSRSPVAETKVTVWSAPDRVSGSAGKRSDPRLVSRPWEPSPSGPDMFWSFFPLRPVWVRPNAKSPYWPVSQLAPSQPSASHKLDSGPQVRHSKRMLSFGSGGSGAC
ncbi:hypothetical protein M514_08866 [Trichuris suis]|uniref:Uncharacterized protein n=1 Tax=Trichuris suis TaxID=68888 RepID=A0A085LZ42_9BILA|nr:hypothetical protein M513_08866 [Trichuris suis]KFD66907.1 hypothetical protein M514_08866 [Trichuris suis]